MHQFFFHWHFQVNDCSPSNRSNPKGGNQPNFRKEIHIAAKKTQQKTNMEPENGPQKEEILLMEEILHQWIGSLSHYLQGFIHPRWCRISSINSRSFLMKNHHFQIPWINFDGVNPAFFPTGPASLLPSQLVSNMEHDYYMPRVGKVFLRSTWCAVQLKNRVFVQLPLGENVSQNLWQRVTGNTHMSGRKNTCLRMQWTKLFWMSSLCMKFAKHLHKIGFFLVQSYDVTLEFPLITGTTAVKLSLSPGFAGAQRSAARLGPVVASASRQLFERYTPWN